MTTESKIGGTFAESFAIKNADGTAFDLTGWTLTAQMRPALNLNASPLALTAGVVSPATAGVTGLTASATATADWPPGLYVIDIKLVKDAEVFHTETFVHLVKPAVTRP